MRLVLVPETVIGAQPGSHQLTMLDALDVASPPDLSTRPATPAMVRVLALAALSSDGVVQLGSLSRPAFDTLCLGMLARRLIRLEGGVPVIAFAGRSAVRTAEWEG